MKIAAAIALIVLAFSAQAQTSKDTPKLKDALKRFPQADANGDGVLTLEEAMAPMISFFGTEDPFLDFARQFQEAHKKGGNRCEIITYEGEGHSFFNKDKYYELTIAETDKFLVGLGWLEKKAGAR